MNRTGYSPPSKNTHFLVSGGGKGITAANSIALAEAYHCRFTLLGRSEIVSKEPAWAEGAQDEPALKQAALGFYQDQGLKTTPKDIGREVNRILSSREILQTLERIKQAGGTAEYLPVDITSPSGLEEQLMGRLDGINGLLHGAGALADKYIEDKTETDFDLVFGVKVGGLRNILDLIPPQQLDYLVLFSSVAGYYGNPGQADYSISNEILNKFAHHWKLAHPHCQVLSIGWGPWDGGMVTPQLKRILTGKKIPLISLEAGSQALIDLLDQYQENPQRVIGNPLPFPPGKVPLELREVRILRKLSLEKNPFLADHVIGGNAVLPTVCAVAWFINSCENLYPGYRFFSIKDYQVYKGIIFDDQSPQDYILDLKELVKSDEKLVFEGKISSESLGGKNRFHYQAQVELRKTPPERPRIKDFDLQETSPTSGGSLYKSRILFHGPSFQGVEQVLNITPAGMTARCRLPQIPVNVMGQFPVRSFNPFLADVHLQTLLIWADSQTGSIGLPLQIAGGFQYQQVPFDKTTYATMKVKTINSHRLVADVFSHDEDGYVFSEVVDAEITLNKKLYALFQNNQLEKEPLWTC